MKKLIIWLITASLLLAMTLPSAAAAGAGTVVYRNTQNVASNLSCTNTISYNSAVGRQQSFSLNLTNGGDAYPIVMACDTIYGGLSASQMVGYAESLGYSVLAAVNTDFYSTVTGVPLGIVIEDGEYKSSPEHLSAVSIAPDGSFAFADDVQVSVSLLNNGSPDDPANAGQTVSLTHFNKYRTDPGGLYLFSSAFSTVSTRTSGDGWFVRFRILDGTPSVDGTMTLEVAETTASDDCQAIGEGYLVLTAGAARTDLLPAYEKFKPGDRVTLTTTCSEPRLADARWATGGGDILLKDGAMTDAAGWDRAITARNPRTALGVKADGTVVTYVIDGRESDHSSGLTMRELAEELLEMGCIDAINLDGGSSSVLSVRMPGTSSCGIINKPCSGAARKIAAYLLFVTDKPSDSRARSLGLLNDGFEVLAGSSVDLDYYAADSGYMPVGAPDDIRVSSSLGSVSGSTYTAGSVHGVDTLTLTSESTGAVGTATAHIIYDPTAVSVMKQGSTASISSLKLTVGDTVQLTADASYYGLTVHFDSNAVTYSLEGDVGTVTETGLFTAATGGGATGTLTVSVGGTSKSIPVKVSGFVDTVDHWADEHIKSLYSKGVVTGVTASTFAPEASIKRGDFVLMLYRAAGKPASSASAAFTDVSAKDYYAAAIAWAETKGIARGTGDGVFQPQTVLTREQAFTLTYRALASLGVGYTDGAADTLGAFSDAGELSEYAKLPTATLVELGVVSGADGRLTPKNEMTRAQMAKMLNIVLKQA